MLARGSGYNRGLATALRFQGLCDVACGYFDRARDLLTEAIALADSMSRARDDDGIAAAFLGLARLLMYQDDAVKGLEVVEQAIRRVHRSCNKGLEGEALALQGECYAMRGDAEKAMEFLKRGMELVEEVDDPPRVTTVLLTAARARRRLGAHSRTMVVVRRGRSLAHLHGLETLVYEFDVISASIRMEIGDDTAALNEFLRASQAAATHGACSALMEAAAGITAIYRRAGDLKSALDWAGQRLEHARTVGSLRQQASTLNTIGNIQYRLGDGSAAMSAYTEALAAAADSGCLDIEEICLENLGNVHRDSARYHEAVECYGRSRRLASARKNRATTASCYYNLGLLDLERSDFTAAIQHLNTAAIAAESGGDLHLLADAHHELSRAYQGRSESGGDVRKAFDHYRIFHRWREALLNGECDRLRQAADLRAEIDQGEFEYELENRGGRHDGQPVIDGGADIDPGSSGVVVSKRTIGDTEPGEGASRPPAKRIASMKCREVNSERSIVSREVEILKREVELREKEGPFVREIATRHPSISPGELRVLLLLRTGMTTPEMSAFLGVTDRAVEKHRYKIRRKLELPTHINLADYVRSVGM